MERGDKTFEHMMRETFPEVSQERIIRHRVAATAIFTFYTMYTPGVHAEERKETFSISGLLPGFHRRRHRFSCEE